MVQDKQKPGRGGAWLWRVLMVIAGLAVIVGVGRTVVDSSQPASPAMGVTDPLAALEARTRDNPDDGEAWSELAARYFDAARFADAAAAYDKAIAQAPRRAALWSARGEARVMASQTDPMPGAAVADFETAFGLDPKDPRARYFLAVRQDLAGDHQGAINAWLALLADTPPGAAWEADLKRTIAQVGKINGIDVAPGLAAVKQPASTIPPGLAAIPGPSAQDIASATAMPPSQQRQMAEGMVARLEARLKRDPGNVDGWIMLIRSRVTLDQVDRAKAALADAIKANPAEAARLREAATTLGLR